MYRSIQTLSLAFLLSSLAAACGDDDGSGTLADAGDPGSDASTSPDAGTDAGGDTDAGDDAGSTDGCTTVTVTGEWTVERDTDVSIGFEARIDPAETGTSGRLMVLFERYVIEPPVGTFTLGEAPNDNYGNCQQCVVAPGLGDGNTFFADRGTLTTTEDPYTRKLKGSLENVRLIEVTVDEFTRESTPVEDGRCIELVDATFDEVFPPDGWTCDESDYSDGAGCHCDCGAWDPDCNGCDPFGGDPSCEELPLVDCTSAETCAHNPFEGEYSCTATCDWAGGTGCTGGGTCLFDRGVDGADTCVGADWIDEAVLGEACEASFIEKGCNVVDGFVQGWCDHTSTCKPLCEGDDDCTVDGESCQFFVFGMAPGYCGTVPSDG